FEMNNGCICCTVRGDLIRIIDGLMKRRDKFDAIIVETTGLADPAPVAQTFFVDEDVRAKTRLDAVVTVVDARHVLARLADTREAKDQIAFADVVLLNKTDLVSPEELAEVEGRIRAINEYAPIHRTERCGIGLDRVLDRGAFDLQRVLTIEPHFLEDEDHGHHHHDHDHDHDHHHGHGHGHGKHYHDEEMASVCLDADRPLDETKFDRWISGVLAEQGPSILRAKGIIDLAGRDKRFVLQAVHMIKDGAFQRPWKPDERRWSRLVFIGRELDADTLKKGFDACRA
ncbi:MAG: GTP-binding protein, partial [Alphaproteobacteria bacterium]